MARKGSASQVIRKICIEVNGVQVVVDLDHRENITNKGKIRRELKALRRLLLQNSKCSVSETRIVVPTQTSTSDDLFDTEPNDTWFD